MVLTLQCNLFIPSNLKSLEFYLRNTEESKIDHIDFL